MAVFTNSQTANPAISKLVKTMRELAAETHPLIAGAVLAPKKTDTGDLGSAIRAKAVSPRKRPQNKSQ
jgi:hypothetical protein